MTLSTVLSGISDVLDRLRGRFRQGGAPGSSGGSSIRADLRPRPAALSIPWRPVVRPEGAAGVGAGRTVDGGSDELFVSQSVFVHILRHLPTVPGEQRFGFLLGNRLRCPATGDAYQLVDATWLAPHPLSERYGSGHFEAALLSARQEAKRLGKVVMGWFHNHSTLMGVRLSDHDLRLHSRFFPEPWQCALLIVPHPRRPAGGFLQRRDADQYPGVELVPFYEVVEEDGTGGWGPLESVVDWENYWTPREGVRARPISPAEDSMAAARGGLAAPAAGWGPLAEEEGAWQPWLPVGPAKAGRREATEERGVAGPSDAPAAETPAQKAEPVAQPSLWEEAAPEPRDEGPTPEASAPETLAAEQPAAEPAAEAPGVEEPAAEAPAAAEPAAEAAPRPIGFPAAVSEPPATPWTPPPYGPPFGVEPSEPSVGAEPVPAALAGTAEEVAPETPAFPAATEPPVAATPPLPEVLFALEPAETPFEPLEIGRVVRGLHAAAGSRRAREPKAPTPARQAPAGRPPPEPAHSPALPYAEIPVVMPPSEKWDRRLWTLRLAARRRAPWLAAVLVLGLGGYLMATRAARNASEAPAAFHPGAGPPGPSRGMPARFEALRESLVAGLAAYEERRMDFELGRIDCAALAVGRREVERRLLELARYMASPDATLPPEARAAYERLSEQTRNTGRHYQGAGCREAEMGG